MSDNWLPPYLSLPSALAIFIRDLSTQSQKHIKPLHQHLALRLVIEGGFLPSEITPHPPLRTEMKHGEELLIFDPSMARDAERTVLGGLKTKDIDVVVMKETAGPVLAISVKGTTGAFRNLTNRMEEAIGDSTNLHIMYPGLVYGFFQVIKGNRAGLSGLGPNDVAIDSHENVVTSIRRYHDVLGNLTGRRFVRDEFSRYEAVGFAVVDTAVASLGTVLQTFPPSESALRPEKFIPTLLQTYDLRFPYVAVSVPNLRRRIWSRRSPALLMLGDESTWQQSLGYDPRVS